MRISPCVTAIRPSHMAGNSAPTLNQARIIFVVAQVRMVRLHDVHCCLNGDNGFRRCQATCVWKTNERALQASPGMQSLSETAICN